MSAANLPPKIMAALRGTFDQAHLIAVAPNTTTALITPKDSAEMPPGYTVILVFPPEDATPDNHEDGKIYVLI